MEEGLRLLITEAEDGEVRGWTVEAELGRLLPLLWSCLCSSIFLSRLLTVADERERLLGLRLSGRPVIISTFFSRSRPINDIRSAVGHSKNISCSWWIAPLSCCSSRRCRSTSLGKMVRLPWFSSFRQSVVSRIVWIVSIEKNTHIFIIKNLQESLEVFQNDL